MVVNTDTQAQVLAVEHAHAAAMVGADVHALDHLIADDYTHVQSSGRTQTKQAFLESVASGFVAFPKFEIGEFEVRTYGDVAVVSGQYQSIARIGGKDLPRKEALFLRVWVRSGNEWRNVAHQSTEVAPTA